MARTIVVCGYGPGISDAMAHKFGAEGFQVALVGRNAERLAAGVEALAAKGITARAFPTDLADPQAVNAMIGEVRSSLGPTTVIHYNAYAPLAGDLLTCEIDDLRRVLDVGITGLVAAVQAALPDMKGQDGSAVLVTGGGFAFYDANVDDMIVQFGAMGLSLTKAAQHKLVGVLHKKLAPEGIYVGELIVLGLVKGTAFDTGNASLEPAAIADAFYKLYQDRSEVSARIS